MDEQMLDEVTKQPRQDPKKEPLTKAHQEGEFRHINDMEFEMLRYPGEWSKMLFHPHPDRPTEPNAGLVKFDPGANHPLHSHYFAQVWYVLEGEFKIGDKVCGPGTMIYYPDPHFERPLFTETGGLMLFVQYPGPTTGKPPIYDGRFNVKKRISLKEERYDW
jgi:mannose-6-phosphate isomerase-like protein (cupin superfamily)